ncbi:MAG: AAA family ATPase [Alphaproteobacteria bacterium GM7ARS4]|nr:AAA family ATPase [Alphaproteobacteria bacterium GM7ARS4]
MRLETISLENFRQFYGEQEFTLSTDEERNVTLIHAENGVGKTALLNALLWCFHGRMTARTEFKERIICDQAREEGAEHASVTVSFEHKDKDYDVKRRIDHSGEMTLKAWDIADGNGNVMPYPQPLVDAVIPDEMANHFFFDGEHAEYFSSQDNTEHVKKAIEHMLGCHKANHAKDNLKAIAETKEREIAEINANDDKTKKDQKKINDLKEQRKKLSEEIAGLKGQLKVEEDKQKSIEQELKDIDKVRVIQEKRERLEKDLKDKKKERSHKEREEIAWISDYSIALLSQRAMEECETVTKKAEDDGKLPSDIAEFFVKEILKRGVCICGRPFEPGSDEEKAIRELLVNAATKTMNDRWLRIKLRSGELKEKRSSAQSAYDKIAGAMILLDSDIDEIERGIKACGKKIRGLSHKEITKKEDELRKTKDRIKSTFKQLGRLEQKCADVEKDIAFANQSLAKKKGKGRDDRAYVMACAWVALIEAACARLNTELTTYREESRHTIIQDINAILDETARREYEASLDESFRLSMFRKDTGAPVGKSGGEKQLLSLAFMAALVKFSADRHDNTDTFLKPGTVAPLFLDSPFGNLDPSYRKATATFLPQMAQQVVILVSSSQGDEDVLGALKGRIGAQYALIVENKGEQGDKPDDILILPDGKRIKTTLYGCERNMTRIEKIR